MRHGRTGRRVWVVAMASVLLLGGLTTPALAGGAEDPTKLAEKIVKQVSASSANRHLIALQRIADRNSGNRSVDDGTIGSNSDGYNASVDYVVGRLQAWGFKVQTPKFSYEVDRVDAASLTVGTENFSIDKMIASIDTPAAGITGPLAVVPQDATTGCEAEDFAGGTYTGTVALIRRGGCQQSCNSPGWDGCPSRNSPPWFVT